VRGQPTGAGVLLIGAGVYPSGAPQVSHATAQGDWMQTGANPSLLRRKRTFSGRLSPISVKFRQGKRRRKRVFGHVFLDLGIVLCDVFCAVSCCAGVCP